MAAVTVRWGSATRHSDEVTEAAEAWFLLNRNAYQRILNMALAEMTSSERDVKSEQNTADGATSELVRLLSGDDMPPGGEQTNYRHHVTAGGSSCHGNSRNTVTLTTVTAQQGQRSSESLRPMKVSISNKTRSEGSGSDTSSCGSSGRADRKTQSNINIKSNKQRQMSRSSEHILHHHDVTARDVNTCHLVSNKQQPECDIKPSITSTRPCLPCFRPSTCLSLPLSLCADGVSSQVSTQMTKVDPSVRPVGSDSWSSGLPYNGGAPAIDSVQCWTPIDKGILVTIVDKLSVSCLPQRQQQQQQSSVNTHSTQVDNVSPAAKHRHQQPPFASCNVSHMKPQATQLGPSLVCLPAPVHHRSSQHQAAVVRHSARDVADLTGAPPIKMPRLTPSCIASKQKVQVRSTWNVPGYHFQSPPPAHQPLAAALGPSPAPSLSIHQHIWRPVDKSLVMNVIDQLLTDDVINSEDDRTPTGSDVAVGDYDYEDVSTCDDVSSGSSGTAVTSFKWKTSILQRVRDEQKPVESQMLDTRWHSLSSSFCSISAGH